MDAELEDSALWAAFLADSEADSQACVARLVEDAAGILDRIVETFPTYTLHNRWHALNVVKQMGNLLGKEGCARLRGLEAAMLILSAYWHDIGMYYKPDELTQVTQEEAFERFLEAHSQAFVDLERNGGQPTQDLVEWYCRWHHADRVYRFINELTDEDLSWNHFPLRMKLGELCRSHNRDLDSLKDDGVFETDWLGECDLRFCAILLRLADILDFDRSRSPEFVYRHIGLDTGDTARLRASNAEWRKHQAASGFRFPGEAPDGPYVLPFGASPDEPTVEHDTREFLKVVDDELKGCLSLQRSCSDRWRDHPLPLQTSPDIHPRGYVYGDYRFELDREQILSLFMGEKLYSSPYVFLRELLQNAIDTSRHRTFFEHSRGNLQFEPRPIEVTEWTDADGYRWVRVDDAGMGMSEQLVHDYFLSVGRSYYRSSDFRAEILRYAPVGGETFSPISQFGIGVLSCFIVGDRVEVSTRRLRTGERSEPPIRLSLQGVESFYVLQREPMPSRPMPSADGGERDYRRDPGTAVAVRLDPSRDSGRLDLPALLDNYLLASPVPVTLNGVAVAAAAADVVESPWIDGVREQTFEWPAAEGAQAEPVNVTAIPLDLTWASPNPHFKGQMVLLVAVEERVEQALRRLEAAPEDDEAREAVRKAIMTSRRGRGRGRLESGTWVLEAGRLPELRVDLSAWFSDGAAAVRTRSTQMRWSSHGVALPAHLRPGLWSELKFDVPFSMLVEAGPAPLAGHPELHPDIAVSVVGILALGDGLDVDLAASRDLVRGIPWHVRSLIQFAMTRACTAAGHPFTRRLLQAHPLGVRFDFIDNVPALRVMLDDPTIVGEGGWGELLPLMAVPDAMNPSHELEDGPAPETLANVLKTHASAVVALPFRGPGAPDHLLGTLSLTLARLHHDLLWAPREAHGGWCWIAERGSAPPISEGERHLPPLFVARYPEARPLRAGGGPLNAAHPFTVWLLAAIPRLRETYAGMAALLLEDVAFNYESGPSSNGPIDRTNAMLETLRRRNFEPRPPAGLKLTREDFV